MPEILAALLWTPTSTKRHYKLLVFRSKPGQVKLLGTFRDGNGRHSYFLGGDDERFDVVGDQDMILAFIESILSKLDCPSDEIPDLLAQVSGLR